MRAGASRGRPAPPPIRRLEVSLSERAAGSEAWPRRSPGPPESRRPQTSSRAKTGGQIPAGGHRARSTNKDDPRRGDFARCLKGIAQCPRPFIAENSSGPTPGDLMPRLPAFDPPANQNDVPRQSEFERSFRDRWNQGPAHHFFPPPETAGGSQEGHHGQSASSRMEPCNPST